MSAARTVASALLSALCSFGLVSALSCGSDGVGVEDCRKIEEARCEAAAHCQGDIHVDDVDACKRYYRDHCLHGLRVDDDPGGQFLGACVRAIQAAGNCANDDPNMTVAECAARQGDRLDTQPSQLVHVCDIVQYPELTTHCEFLHPQPPPERPAEAGAEAAVGGAGGASG